jgi:hypothetical protein
VAGSGRPFEVDAEVLAHIRPMRVRDVPSVARQHAAAMGQSSWAQLGTRFLDALYAALLADPRFVGFVYEEDGRVRGFIAGTTDADRMMRAVFRARWGRLALAAVPALRPRLAWKLVETARYKDRSGAGIAAESLFCSFEEHLRGKRVSGHINKVLFDELLSRGHKEVKITTEVDNEGANRQLQSWGFEERGRFAFYGKRMVTYVLDLERSPRVEAVSRWTPA